MWLGLALLTPGEGVVCPLLPHKEGALQLPPTCWPGHMASGSPDSWPWAGQGDKLPSV